jgi:hypothetical protein
MIDTPLQSLYTRVYVSLSTVDVSERNELGSPSVYSIEEPPERAEAGWCALTLEKERVQMSALHTMEALRREMEKRLDDSGARIVRTKQLLAGSSALLQQSKIPRPRVSPPVRQYPDLNCPTTAA